MFIPKHCYNIISNFNMFTHENIIYSYKHIMFIYVEILRTIFKPTYFVITENTSST
jgi:hypothetical protein